MNKTPILKKCVDELGQEKPRLDYVLGMLETLLSLEDSPRITIAPGPQATLPSAFGQNSGTLDAERASLMGKVDLSALSEEQ